ncbi:hypothetical protein CHARACLAT_028798, partial [Characodon lateralis]|nr:hypothetical protein [Characodon lateralis]
IQKHVACHKLNTLYSSSGEVNLDVLQEMLADNKQRDPVWSHFPAVMVHLAGAAAELLQLKALVFAFSAIIRGGGPSRVRASSGSRTEAQPDRGV